MASSTSQRAVTRERARDLGPGVFLAVACLALGALPLFGTAPGWHWLTVIAFMAAGIGLLWRAWPSAARPEAAEHALACRRRAGSGAIHLTSRAAEARGRAGTSYAAVLVGDGPELVLAESGDPASVLEVAQRCADLLEAPLKPGWGLSQADLDALQAPAPGLPLAPRELCGASQQGTLGIVISLVASAIALSLLVSAVAMLREGTLGLASALLWAGGVLALLGVAQAVRTEQTHVVFGDTVRMERRVLGRLRYRFELDAKALQVLRAVSPDGGYARHLLIAGAGQVAAVQCAQPLARAAEDALGVRRGPVAGRPQVR